MTERVQVAVTKASPVTEEPVKRIATKAPAKKAAATKVANGSAPAKKATKTTARAAKAAPATATKAGADKPRAKTAGGPGRPAVDLREPASRAGAARLLGGLGVPHAPRLRLAAL